jgi:hypothetical protein
MAQEDKPYFLHFIHVELRACRCFRLYGSKYTKHQPKVNKFALLADRIVNPTCCSAVVWKNSLDLELGWDQNGFRDLLVKEHSMKSNSSRTSRTIDSCGNLRLHAGSNSHQLIIVNETFWIYRCLSVRGVSVEANFPLIVGNKILL